MQTASKEESKKLKENKVIEKPEPAIPTLTKELKDLAGEIAKRQDGLLVSYIRDVSRRAIKGVEVKFNGVYKYIYGEGAPVAVIVAFRSDKSNQVYVGWSKRNSAMETVVSPKTGEERRVPLEPLPFGKKDAKRCAVMRALADTIKVIDDKYYYSKVTGNRVPAVVANAIPEFISRARKYFKDDEIDINLEVVNNDSGEDGADVDKGV